MKIFSHIMFILFMLASGAQQICFQLEIGPETLGNASIYNLILAILFRMNILEEEI